MAFSAQWAPAKSYNEKNQQKSEKEKIFKNQPNSRQVCMYFVRTSSHLAFIVQDSNTNIIKSKEWEENMGRATGKIP